MKRLIPLITVVIYALTPGAIARPAGAAHQPSPPQGVRIAAASDLKFALDDVVARFVERHPHIRVEPTYGSSGNFHAQLQQRAPFDIFLSADIDYARDLVSRGVGATSDVFAYATGRLVVWVRRDSPLPIEREGLSALRGARRIAIANPRHAPYGRAAEAALRNAGLWSALEARLVLGENIAQAAQFVQSGAADAGVIAKSLALAPAMSGSGRLKELPSSSHPEIRQGGLLLPWAQSREAAVAFREFLLSADGGAILARHGLGIPAK